MNETSPESQTKEVGSSIVSEQERELAQNALTDFEKGQYFSCLTHLNKLEALRPKDLKVTHNKVIVEYYKSDLKKTELMKKSLNAICGQANSNDSLSSVDDVEKCVSRYNQAILLYHTKQYDAALNIMNRLFTYIEPLEESLAHKVCLLLIELHIATNQIEAALSLVNYIESQFITTDASKMSSNDKDNLVKPIKEHKDQKKDSVDVANDAFKIKLLKYKARIYLLTHQLKLCKREWKTLVSLGMPMNISSIFLKANLEYLRGNYKKSMKLLNSVTENTDFKNCGESAAVFYYNNIGCIHHAMGKPNLACFYIRKALEENQKAVESLQVQDADVLSAQPLCTLSGNKHYELMFSLGVCLLHAGQATKALDCFTEAAQKLHNKPELWLRMAECCIFAHKTSNEVDFNIPKRRRDLIEKVVGAGPYRKIILASSLSKNPKYHTEGLSNAMPQATLEFGMLCLKNALFLLPNHNEVSLSVTSIGSNQTGSISLTHSPPSGSQDTTQTPSASTIEALNLKISVLADSAYISLCLGDYVLALEYAKSLLSVSKLPGAYKMLGNLYAAESLIFLDKINEAIEYLKPDNLQDLSTFIPIAENGEKDKEKAEEIDKRPLKSWYPTTIPTGKAILRYNLAVAYAIRGELSKSSETLKQVWMSKGSDCNVPIHVIMLALYIELQLGHADVSRSIIKQHCPLYR